MPVSPAAAVVRLSQVKGALARQNSLAGLFSPDTPAQLQSTLDNLLNAIETGDHAAVADAFQAAQRELCRLYEALCQSTGEGEAAANLSAAFAALSFPPPGLRIVQPVDVTTVFATFTKSERQVLTTLVFEHAAGATAYWLREVRTLHGEPIDDHLLESYSPVFTRVRLAIGPHVFRIETRNPRQFTVSEPFTIEIPAL